MPEEQERFNLNEDAILAKQCLNNYDWSVIFTNERLMNAITDLHKQDYITRDFYESIWLMKRQYDEHGTMVAVHPLLDERGNFTQEAEDLFIPTIENNKYLPRMTPEKKEAFRARLLELPPAERVFITHKNAYLEDCKRIKGLRVHPLREDLLEKFENKKALSFYIFAVHFKSIWLNEELDTVIHPALGMYNEVLGPILYGDNFKRRVPMEGKISVRDIERGLLNNIRITRSVVPQPSPLGPYSADNRECDTLTFVGHDWYHSDVYASIPQHLNDAYTYMIFLIRSKLEQASEFGRLKSFKIKKSQLDLYHEKTRSFMTSAIWELIDRANIFDNYRFFHKSLHNPERFFFNTLRNTSFPSSKDQQWLYLIYIEMALNRDYWWKKFQIDVKYFNDNPLFQCILENERLFKRYHSSPVLSSLLCHLLAAALTRGDKEVPSDKKIQISQQTVYKILNFFESLQPLFDQHPNLGFLGDITICRSHGKAKGRQFNSNSAYFRLSGLFTDDLTKDLYEIFSKPEVKERDANSALATIFLKMARGIKEEVAKYEHQENLTVKKDAPQNSVLKMGFFSSIRSFWNSASEKPVIRPPQP